jgi:alpha-L-fucosidase
MTMNDTWGYMRDDNHFKSTETLIRNLIDIASKGGNYLLNVGPTSEGLIPQPEVDRLEQIGAWMKVNSEAVYGTRPTIFGAEDGSFSTTETNRNGGPKFVTAWDWRCTSKPGKHFLHFFKQPGKLYIEIFNWPVGQITLPAVKGKITKACLLADANHQALKFQQTAQGVAIQLPDQAPDAIASVLCLTVKGELAAADKTP